MAKSPPVLPNNWIPVNSDITLVPGKKYIVDASSPRTLTLPAITPSNYGKAIALNDIYGYADLNNISIAPAGSDIILGVTGNLLIDINSALLDLIPTAQG
jgi:hypothetical protein